MRTKRLLKVALGLCLLICQASRAQQSDDALNKLLNFPSRYIDNVQQNYARLDDQLTKQTEKCLKRLAKQENKLKRKLSKTDTAAAQQLFANSEQQYARLASAIKNKAAGITNGASGEYVPYVDSVKTALSFLQQNNQVLPDANKIESKLSGSLKEVDQLKATMQQTEQVQAFIQQRKQQIKDALSKYSNLPKSITSRFADFNKQAYYYSQQVKDYKDLLNDPDRMIQKGLSLLNKLPAFQQFMQQHSELASLFKLPDNYGAPQSLAGLQTRTLVQQQIQTQLAGAGPNAQQYLQQNLQTAQGQLNQLKDKINKLGGNSGDIDMPDFKPNEQKTKTFWKRLEYGTNFQTAQANYFFPTTSDLGLSVGYKLNNNSTIGIGASYKMGWGRDIRHIAITHEGMGVRSFADVKLKGSFYASGGFEYNYQPLNITLPSSTTGGGGTAPAAAAPASSAEGRNGNWYQSGLIGMSKVVSLKSNVFKKTKLQLLWDFMSYQQVPRTQPVKFRVGYNF